MTKTLEQKLEDEIHTDLVDDNAYWHGRNFGIRDAIAIVRAHEAETTTSWTCPDCCKNPCECKFFSNSETHKTEAVDESEIRAILETIPLAISSTRRSGNGLRNADEVIEAIRPYLRLPQADDVIKPMDDAILEDNIRGQLESLGEICPNPITCARTVMSFIRPYLSQPQAQPTCKEGLRVAQAQPTEDVVECLWECIIELEAEIETKYKDSKHYPSELRRYKRDIALVERSKAALAAYAIAAYEEKKHG